MAVKAIANGLQSATLWLSVQGATRPDRFMRLASVPRDSFGCGTWGRSSMPRSRLAIRL
jgi:hypothetical protein